MSAPQSMPDGGWVTFKVLVTVPGLAANPDFTRDDVIAHAEAHLGELEDYADSNYLITFSKPYEIVEVEQR